MIEQTDKILRSISYDGFRLITIFKTFIQVDLAKSFEVKVRLMYGLIIGEIAVGRI